MAELNRGFSERLKALLDENQISQAELARKIGITKSIVTKYAKHGGVPEWNILVEVARLLNVTTDYLLMGEETGLSEISAGEGCIGLPQVDPRPLGATEQRYLEKALEILRATGCRGQPDQALINSIDSLHTLVEIQGGADSKPGGERATTGKRNRTGSKGA